MTPRAYPRHLAIGIAGVGDDAAGRVGDLCQVISVFVQKRESEILRQTSTQK
jgi:hypothetical protein